MNALFKIPLLLLLFAFTACNNESSSVDESDKLPEKEASGQQEKQEDEVSDEPTKKVQQMYQPGRYYLELDKGSIVLLIHAKTDTTCRFVFDTEAGTPYQGKLAGDLKIDEKGKASYSGTNCKALDFHFTEAGISVKEFDCNFHSRTISFDGLYTTKKPLSDDPKVLLRELEKGEVDFDFYANFTEPFWTLYFIEDLVLFNSADEIPDIYIADKPFNPLVGVQHIRFSKRDKHWEVVIKRGQGSDGMSNIIYPFSVVMDSTFYGGGGTEFVREDE